MGLCIPVKISSRGITPANIPIKPLIFGGVADVIFLEATSFSECRLSAQVRGVWDKV